MIAEAYLPLAVVVEPGILGVGERDHLDFLLVLLAKLEQAMTAAAIGAVLLGRAWAMVGRTAPKGLPASAQAPLAHSRLQATKAKAGPQACLAREVKVVEAEAGPKDRWTATPR